MLIKDFIEKNKWLLVAFAGLGLLAGLNNWHSRPPDPSKNDASPAATESVDTMIPKGYILVPLELENIEQVSSLIGNSGVVDLYTGGTENKKRRLVASRVKVIQAPLNPQVY